jgi:hypothetical protein
MKARLSPVFAPSVMQPRCTQLEGRGDEGVGDDAAVLAVVVDATVVLDGAATVVELETVDELLDELELEATTLACTAGVPVEAVVVAVVVAAVVSLPINSHMLNLLAAPHSVIASPLQGMLHCSIGICLPPLIGASPPHASAAYSVPHHLIPAA